MVQEEVFEGQTAFVCEACGFHYETRQEAQRCEVFCEEQNACDPDIIKNALENRDL